jgi:hypothetical protein
VQPIDALVAATEPTRSTEIGVDDDTRDVVRHQPIRVPDDAHVLEAVHGVPGLEGVVVATRGHDPIRLTHTHLGVCEMVERDVTVRVERFAVDQRHGGARRSEIAEADASVDVLAEVDDLALVP